MFLLMVSSSVCFWISILTIFWRRILILNCFSIWITCQRGITSALGRVTGWGSIRLVATAFHRPSLGLLARKMSPGYLCSPPLAWLAPLDEQVIFLVPNLPSQLLPPGSGAVWFLASGATMVHCFCYRKYACLRLESLFTPAFAFAQ